MPCSLSEGTRQERTFRRVVLPDPDAPIIADTSPALNIPETSFNSYFDIFFLQKGKLID